MTREEWLQHAVEMIDVNIFGGELDTFNRKYQIDCGICPGKKLTNTIQPYDGEDVKLEDFFPTTISVSHKIKDPIEMLGNLARECVFAFFNEKKINKKTKKLFNKFYFDAPYTSYHPTEILKEMILDVYNNMVKTHGEFPGVAVVTYPKANNKANKNTVVMFCPDCGYEIKVTKKVYNKYGMRTPVCVCGTNMAVDCEDENSEDTKG